MLPKQNDLFTLETQTDQQDELDVIFLIARLQ